jgi:PAS domain S-box-containing protein
MPAELFKDLWKTIRSGKVWIGEVKNLKKDGGFYWVNALVEPEFDDNGKITGYNAIRQDITAKKEVEELSQSLEQKVEEQTKDLTIQLEIVKKAEETIRQNNNHMTFVAEKANLGFWSFNPQSGDASVNDTFATMLGYKSDEVLKDGYKNEMFKPFKSGLDFWKELLHPEDRERTTKALTAHINGESDIYKVDYRMRRKDGTWMWSTAIGKNAEYDDDGKAIRFNGVNLDIDEQKELELEIQSQKDFVETLLDSQEQLILTTDGFKLTSVNKTFLNFFSVNSVSDFREKYNVSCICETFNTHAPKDYLQIEMDGQKWIDYVIDRPNQIHKAMITLDDKSFIFSATATDLPGGSGLKSAVFTDITEMENAKKEIELILSNILLPVLITSKKERKILYANKYAENQYEVSLDKLIGSDIDDIYTMKGQQEHIIDEINKYGFIENSEEQFKTSTNKVFTA